MGYIGKLLASCLLKDVGKAVDNYNHGDPDPEKVSNNKPVLDHPVPTQPGALNQIAVYQTGIMRADYFQKYRTGEQSIIPAEAHMIFGDDYGDYGYLGDDDEDFDYDYDYEDYYVDEYDDEGYDEYDDYSLYQQAAVNLKRAREEFRVAQQLMKWKGRGNSRLMRRYNN